MATTQVSTLQITSDHHGSLEYLKLWSFSKIKVIFSTFFLCREDFFSKKNVFIGY